MKKLFKDLAALTDEEREELAIRLVHALEHRTPTSDVTVNLMNLALQDLVCDYEIDKMENAL